MDQETRDGPSEPSRGERTSRRRLVVVLGAVLALTAACSSSSSPHRSTSPTDPIPSSTSALSSTSSTPTSTTPTSSTPSPDAIKAEVEGVWLNYWKVTLSLENVPEASRPGLVHRIAVDPIYGELINSIRAQADDGYVGYGFVRTRPTWPAAPPVTATSKSAVMNDCFDGSHAGLKDKRTGAIHTRGTPRTNVKVTFALGADRVWRVHQIEYLKAPC